MIDHLSEEQINDFLDARLPPAIETEGRFHLAECSDCTDATNRIAAVIAAAREVRIGIQPRHNLWHAIAHETVAVPRSRNGRNPWIYAIILTAIVFTAVTVALFVARPWDRKAIRVAGVINTNVGVVQAGWKLLSLREMRNDAAKVAELRRLIPVAATDPAQRLWTDFFAVVSTIESSNDRRKILLDVVPLTVERPAVTAMIIESVEPILSSSNKTDVLVALAKAGSVSTPALHDQYLDVTMSITSPKDRARAREAVERK